MIASGAVSDLTTRRARSLAWGLVLLLAALVLVIALAIAFGVLDRRGELDGLRERLVGLQTRRLDPVPLERALKTLNAQSPAQLGYFDTPDEEQAVAAFEQQLAGIAAANQAQITKFARRPLGRSGTAAVLGIDIACNLPSAS